MPTAISSVRARTRTRTTAHAPPHTHSTWHNTTRHALICDRTYAGDREFFNGAEPGLVDVHLFGVLRSVADEATGHYALAHAHPRLPAWYQRMQRLTAHDGDQPTTTTATTTTKSS